MLNIESQKIKFLLHLRIYTGHSLLPEVFQNYWPSCAQKNWRILDESFKKQIKKSPLKTPLKLSSLLFVCSLCVMQLILLSKPELSIHLDNGRNLKSQILLYCRQRRGRTRPLSSAQPCSCSPRSETTAGATFCTVTTKTTSVFKLLQRFRRITRVQCNTNSLLEARDTRVSTGAGGCRGPELPPRLPGTNSTQRALLPRKRRQKRAGDTRLICTNKSPSAENSENDFDLLSLRQDNQDIVTLQLHKQFHPSTLLLQHVLSNSIYFLLSFQ